jgi:spermidine synthase
LLTTEIKAIAQLPDGSKLSLGHRGDEWLIFAGNIVLMSSRRHHSEEALAEEAITRATNPTRVLVGGLGLGYTLRAVLDRVSQACRVTIAELVPEVVAWNHEYLGHLSGQPLLDVRSEVVVSDVYDLIKGSHATYDVILLDVDNGPVALSDAGNQRLYGEQGVRAAYRSLRPQGVLAVWSAGPSPHYNDLLARAGFAVTTLRVAAFKGARAQHVLHVATRAPKKP